MNGSKLVKLIVALVIVLIGFLVYKNFFSQPKSGYDIVLTNMCDAIEKGDFDKYESYMTLSFSDFTNSEKNAVKAVEFLGMSNIKKTYGDNIDIKYDITKVRDFKADKGQEIVNKFCNTLKIDTTNVTNVYYLRLNYTIKGDKKSATKTTQCVFIEKNGQYFPLQDFIVSDYYTT